MWFVLSRWMLDLSPKFCPLPRQLEILPLASAAHRHLSCTKGTVPMPPPLGQALGPTHLLL